MCSSTTANETRPENTNLISMCAKYSLVINTSRVEEFQTTLHVVYVFETDFFVDFFVRFEQMASYLGYSAYLGILNCTIDYL